MARDAKRRSENRTWFPKGIGNDNVHESELERIRV